MHLSGQVLELLSGILQAFTFHMVMGSVGKELVQCYYVSWDLKTEKSSRERADEIDLWDPFQGHESSPIQFIYFLLISTDYAFYARQLLFPVCVLAGHISTSCHVCQTYYRTIEGIRLDTHLMHWIC